MNLITQLSFIKLNNKSEKACRYINILTRQFDLSFKKISDELGECRGDTNNMFPCGAKINRTGKTYLLVSYRNLQ